VVASDRETVPTTTSRLGLAGRLGGFLGVPMLSAVAPMLILPFLSRIAGQEGWGTVGAAQAIGTLGSIVALFGWGMYGPPAVARTTDRRERQRLYHDSIVVRRLALAVVLPVCLLITWFVVDPAWRLDSLLMAGTFAFTAILPGWYCIGVGQPMLMARYDVVPRFVATLAAIPLMVVTDAIWPYPALMLVTTMACTQLFGRRELAGYDPSAQPARSLAARVRQSAAAAGADTAANAYGTLPLPIATASVTAADASAFSSVDRFYRVGVTVVVGALGNAFQAWVLDAAAPDPRRRQVVAIGAHTVVGAVGLVLLAVLGPWVTGVVFGGDVAAHRVPSIWFGVAFFFISLSSPLVRNLLIPTGHGRLVLGATLVSSVLGLVTMAVGALQSDTTVIAAGLAASQVALVALLLRPALARLPEVRTA